MNNYRINRFYLFWVISALSVGLGLGIIIWLVPYNWYAILPIITSIAAILIGITQWFVLWIYFAIKKWWILATAIGGAVGSIFGWIIAILVTFLFGRIGDWIAGQAFGDILGGAIGWITGGFFAGAILGVAQWLVLQQAFRGAHWWVLETAVAYSVASIVGANVNRILGTLGSIGGLITAILSSAIIGLITGIALLLVVSNSTTNIRSIPEDRK